MNIRRYYVPNSIYFLTVVTYKRKPIFADETNLDIFSRTLRAVKGHSRIFDARIRFFTGSSSFAYKTRYIDEM